MGNHSAVPEHERLAASSSDGEPESSASEQERVLGVYFGQVFDVLGGDEDELGAFPEADSDREATHPLTTLAAVGGSVARTTTVTCLGALVPHSVALVPTRPSPHGPKYRLHATLDCAAPCTVQLWRDYRDPCVLVPVISLPERVRDGAGARLVGERAVQRGLGRRYESPSMRHFPLFTGDADALASGRYSLALKIAPTAPLGNDVAQYQLTLMQVIKNDESLEVKVAKQLVVYENAAYVVHDIYGINHTTAALPEDCVICLTELRNTVVIPCRHLCVCHQCAQVLRYQSNKCPICRGPARAMLRVDVEEGREEDDLLELSASSDEGESIAVDLSASPPEGTAPRGSDGATSDAEGASDEADDTL